MVNNEKLFFITLVVPGKDIWLEKRALMSHQRGLSRERVMDMKG